jgi:hypothetical protein
MKNNHSDSIEQFQQIHKNIMFYNPVEFDKIKPPINIGKTIFLRYLIIFRKFKLILPDYNIPKPYG